MFMAMIVYNLGSLSKDCQRFVDSFLISASDWSNNLNPAFERGTMLDFAQLYISYNTYVVLWTQTFLGRF